MNLASPALDYTYVGVAWWNGLSEMDRLRWLNRAGSDCPGDAWELFKAIFAPCRRTEVARQHGM